MSRFAVLLFGALVLAGCGDEAMPPAPAPENGVAATPVADAVDPGVGADPVDPAPVDGPGIALDGEGLRLVDATSGRATPLAFGTPRATIERALSSRGPGEAGSNAECGAGPLDYLEWSDGLTLWFQEGAFAGWRARTSEAGTHSTMNGIMPGMTRAALTESGSVVTFSEDTLGAEFAAGDIFGFLDGTGDDARVREIYAGVSCNFR
ncbi:hypothetical protein [Sphingomonas baiyangensis]|uniref:Aspartate-semialdehyde dehydrogenase n=1 Tax=Sphingomonas baiyangensis TaxID=2572576 RepID=A0A4U1L612_9SPHN|nr:hypothetical protein [Sphingomonas baiyangensis]TKD51710.1 hypothetical protein FBR43_13800 [Sphingomonas baiyangensis]